MGNNGFETEKKRKRLITVAVLAVLAGILFVCVFFMIKSEVKDEDEVEELVAENKISAKAEGVVAATVDEDEFIEMVYVPGGTFMMGASDADSSADSDERPAHEVTLSSFRIGKYEVTQKQWKEIMGSNPSYFKGDNLPVENVSWNDVQEFIRKLNARTGKNYRLPTEAEWEYAARGGNNSRGYEYSGSDNIGSVAWYGSNSKGQTHPVGSKSPNELGIYDMSGNVWEWCSDWFGEYSGESQRDPKGPSTGDSRVLRGGSWDNYERNSRSTFRDGYYPHKGDDRIGFRLAE